MIKVTKLEIEGVLVLEYESGEDNRGSSHRIFSERELNEIGLDVKFVEETIYCPAKAGTLYGIHFQNNPMAQSKLLYCIKGSGVDYAVDLRKDSKTYKKWVCVELSESNRKQIFIPAGFGHAFLSKEDNTQVVMRIDNYFDPELCRGIAYDDIDLDIDYDIANPILSEFDSNAPSLEDCDINL